MLAEYRELISLKNQAECHKILKGVLEEQIMMKAQEILENYPNEIWKGSDGRWRTHLPNESRDLIARSSKKRVQNAILDYYLEAETKASQRKLTLNSLYPDWLRYKGLKSNSTTYAPRIDCDWRKYYLHDPIIHVPVIQLNRIQLETWAYSKISENNMKLTKTQYYNMTTIIRGILDYTVDLGIINQNPFRDFKISKGHFRRPEKKKSETQVYLEDEELELIKVAEADYKKTQYTACLAICLNFYLGLRIGELVGLKVNDRDGDYVHIQRQEIRNMMQQEDGTWITNGYLTDDYLKGDKEVRILYLTADARKFWDMITEHNKKHGYEEDYLIIHDGMHVHAPSIHKRLTRYCRQIEIGKKSNHKIRKTVLSKMVDEVGLDEAQEWGGHSSKATLLKNYHYSRRTPGEKEMAIEKALEKKSVTACNRKSQKREKPEALII